MAAAPWPQPMLLQLTMPIPSLPPAAGCTPTTDILLSSAKETGLRDANTVRGGSARTES